MLSFDTREWTESILFSEWLRNIENLLRLLKNEIGGMSVHPRFHTLPLGNILDRFDISSLPLFFYSLIKISFYFYCRLHNHFLCVPFTFYSIFFSSWFFLLFQPLKFLIREKNCQTYYFSVRFFKRISSPCVSLMICIYLLFFMSGLGKIWFKSVF